jgi:acetoin:2,6-dichlorophenolindophenol oxidoreductase subunit beta
MRIFTNMSRELSYSEAIREATFQVMKKDPSVIVMGEGVNDPTGMFGSTLDLWKTFGKSRVIDVPNSENAFTGMAVGAALTGLRPIIVHQRNDFLLLSMDQIASQAAKWSYMFSGKAHVPMVIRAVVGRGWGQGAQHSQSLHSLFMHFPGLKVLLPSNAYDAKGMLVAALTVEKSPIIIIEHRWLYKTKAPVPAHLYAVPLDKAKVLETGKDITIVAASQCVEQAVEARKLMLSMGVDAEVIDIRSARPIDVLTIRNSVKKTGNLVVVDGGWRSAGLSSEIVSVVVEDSSTFKSLKSAVKRVTWADTPVPTSYVLENMFYPTAETIVGACVETLRGEILNLEGKYEDQKFHKKRFAGSF